MSRELFSVCAPASHEQPCCKAGMLVSFLGTQGRFVGRHRVQSSFATVMKSVASYHWYYQGRVVPGSRRTRCRTRQRLFHHVPLSEFRRVAARCAYSVLLSSRLLSLWQKPFSGYSVPSTPVSPDVCDASVEVNTCSFVWWEFEWDDLTAHEPGTYQAMQSTCVEQAFRDRACARVIVTDRSKSVNTTSCTKCGCDLSSTSTTKRL